MFSQPRSVLWAAAATAVALGAMACTARANLLTNGDFSANASSYTNFPGYDAAGGNPAAPTGWTATAPALYGGLGVNGPDTGTAANFAPGATNNVLPPASGTGSQDFAFLQSGLTSAQGSMDPAVFSQTFSTTVGEKYVVTFDAAQNGNDPTQGHPDYYAQLQVQALDSQNNSLASANSFTNGGLSVNDTSWTGNTLDFTADTTSTELVFSNATGSVAGEAVDFTNVVVSPVPEPATWGLLAMGVAGILLMGRKRKVA